MEDNTQIVVFNGTEYEIAQVNAKVTNKSRTINVVLIDHTGYIAVGEGIRIYNGKNGKPILSSRFSNVVDAIGLAELIYNTYREFLPIWDDYPDADVIKWCRYTVTDGDILHRMIEILNENSKISNLDVSVAWNTARKEIENEYRTNKYYKPELLT
jgi:hypothetical protein